MNPSTLPVTRYLRRHHRWYARATDLSRVSNGGEQPFHCSYSSTLKLYHSLTHQTMLTNKGLAYCPSGENPAHSQCDLAPNLIVFESIVGGASSSSSRVAAFPRNTSNDVPGGSRPTYCCHRSACPMSASRRDGGTTFTSVDSAVGRVTHNGCLLLLLLLLWGRV